MGNLFEGLDEFRIVDVDGVVQSSPNYIIIEEPVGFDDLNISLKRRPEDRGGVNFEFGDEESLLLFDKVAGKELIEGILAVNGTDSKILLEYYNDGTLRYSGNIVGSSMDKEDATIGFRVRREDFDNKLQTRFDSIINVESPTDFDDNAITPIQLEQLALHSNIIRKISNRRSIEHTPAPSYFPSNIEWTNNSAGEGQLVFGVPISSSGSVDEYFDYGNTLFLEDLSNGGILVQTDFAGAIDGTVEDNEFFILKSASKKGNIRIQLDVNFDVILTELTAGVGNNLDMSIACRVRQKNAAGEIINSDIPFNQTFDIDPNFASSGGNKVNVTFSFDETWFFNRDDRLFIYMRFFVVGAIGANPVFAVWDGLGGQTAFIEDVQIVLTEDSIEVPSLSTGAYYYDMLQKCLEYVTGNNDALISSYFERIENGAVSDACGALNFITTGFKIREFNEDLTITIKDLVEFAKARFGCGFAIINDGGSDKLLLEKQEHFFQNKKILTITDVHNPVTRKVNKEILFNESLVGYKKFTRANERGTIEGFNTQSSHLLPIEKDKKKIQILSDIIADDAEIERVRRNSLLNSADESDEKDDDPFVIKVQRFNDTNPYVSANYLDLQVLREATNGRIVIDGLIILGVANGDHIHISGQPIRQIDGTVELDLENNQTILPVSTETNDDALNLNFYFSDAGQNPMDTFTPERREGHLFITGLIDADKTYNVDHAPTQFIIQNFAWFGGSMLKKAGTKVFKFLKKKNRTVLSKAEASAACSLTTDLIAEDDDLLLSDLRSYSTEIFNEDLYEFKARVSIDNILRIRDAMRNEAVDDINYGFLEHPDEDGNLVEAYLFDMEYNPDSEEASFITWGKNN